MRRSLFTLGLLVCLAFVAGRTSGSDQNAALVHQQHTNGQQWSSTNKLQQHTTMDTLPGTQLQPEAQSQSPIQFTQSITANDTKSYLNSTITQGRQMGDALISRKIADNLFIDNLETIQSQLIPSTVNAENLILLANDNNNNNNRASELSDQLKLMTNPNEQSMMSTALSKLASGEEPLVAADSKKKKKMMKKKKKMEKKHKEWKKGKKHKKVGVVFALYSV